MDVQDRAVQTPQQSVKTIERSSWVRAMRGFGHMGTEEGVWQGSDSSDSGTWAPRWLGVYLAPAMTWWSGIAARSGPLAWHRKAPRSRLHPHRQSSVRISSSRVATPEALEQVL